MSVSLTGNDTAIIDGRILNDLADGDTVSLDFPNNLVEAKVGKNGNTLYAFNSTGRTVTATIRVIRGSADDKYLNGRQVEYIRDSAAFVLLEGEFIKRAGDGAGNVVNDIYRLRGGVVQKLPNTKESVEGDTEQSVTIWQILFANTDRVIA